MMECTECKSQSFHADWATTKSGLRCGHCAASRITELETIVDALPKIGRLVGDKIVLDVIAQLGDMIFTTLHGKVVPFPVFRLDKAETGAWLSYNGSQRFLSSLCFDSRAAAEFAIKQKGQ